MTCEIWLLKHRNQCPSLNDLQLLPIKCSLTGPSTQEDDCSGALTLHERVTRG